LKVWAGKETKIKENDFQATNINMLGNEFLFRIKIGMPISDFLNAA
jgi:hypothetical protein